MSTSRTRATRRKDDRTADASFGAFLVAHRQAKRPAPEEDGSDDTSRRVRSRPGRDVAERREGDEGGGSPEDMQDNMDDQNGPHRSRSHSPLNPPPSLHPERDSSQPPAQQPPAQQPPAQQQQPNVEALRAIFYASPTLGLDSPIDEIKRGAEFVHALKNATLEESNLSQAAINDLRHPSSEALEIDEDMFFALRAFFSSTGSSEEGYNNYEFATKLRHPDPAIRYYSFHDACRLVEKLSGVVPMTDDMCINTCIGYTGPWRDLDKCFECSEPRYGEDGKARRTFRTLPLAPIAQSLYALPETAEKMGYRVRETERVLQYARTNNGKIEIINDILIINDIFCGTDYLKAVQEGRIGPNDITFQISLDGAQLYRDKKSDCWIFIYIFSGVDPELRYTKKWVFPGGVIGGPEKPKHTDSFLFPAFHHIAAVNKEGLSYYDASRKTIIIKSHLYCLFGCADGPAMCSLDGTVTVSGKYACRLHCKLSGRRWAGDGHYYPALLLPYNYSVSGCDHPDVSFQDLAQYRKNATNWYDEGLKKLVTARNRTQYEEFRRETGICKPSILLGLFDILGVPKMFAADLMHLGSLNHPDLFISLWHGTLNVYEPDSRDQWRWLVLRGKVWEAHGETVARATKHIPSSFGRPPRDIAKKLNSQYKANEYLLYLYCLAPALLRSILPFAEWQNLCKFVHGMRPFHQQKKIGRDQIINSNQVLAEFEREYEELYYQRRPERIHFVRQSIHLLSHLGPETLRLGPLPCYAQWTMETLIGNLEKEMRSDVQPNENLSNRAAIRTQLNAVRHKISSKIPLVAKDLKEGSDPRSSKQVGDTGYLLLARREDALVAVEELEAQAIHAFWDDKGWPNKAGWGKAVKRWARLRLPNGQLARSLWMEARPGLRRELRVTRNVKLLLKGKTEFAEVRYYFRIRFDDGTIHSLALVSMFSPPDKDLFKESYQTVYACYYRGNAALQVIEITDIEATVAMIPFMEVTRDGQIVVKESQYFVMENPLLNMRILLGEQDEGDEDGSEDQESEELDT